MKNKILEKLQNSDGYVSGQELCELLGVSRTAVWKNIQALKNEGYVIEGVNNKGYRLVSEPDVMSEEKISKYLETRTFARKLYYYDETDSTNTRAKIVGKLTVFTELCSWQMSRLQERDEEATVGILIRARQYPCRICSSRT